VTVARDLRSDPTSHAAALVPVVQDFRKNVQFRDVMPMLADPDALAAALEVTLAWATPLRPQYVACLDARGFILGGALATRLGAGFIAIRKAGKLPGRTIKREFTGEYATDTVEMRADLVPPGARVLIHDDILATGNSVRAAAELIEEAGGQVAGISVLIEKAFLGGRTQVPGREIFSFLRFDS
jgi:adenine phosphoribosyltransferase